MTTLDSTDDQRSEPFEKAWHALDSARQLRHDIATHWNEVDIDSALCCQIYLDEQGLGELRLSVEWPTQADAIQQSGRDFIAAVQDSLNAAIQATERLTSGITPTPDRPIQFPLCSTPSEFTELHHSGALDGLRPDHLQLVALFQPYAIEAEAPPQISMLRSAMGLLKDVANLDPDAKVFGIWAHSVQPTVVVDSPHKIVELVAASPTLVQTSAPIARFRVEPTEGARGLRGRPGVALDIAFALPPWPGNPDKDTVGRRCASLLKVAAEIVRGFERSVGLREPPNRPDLDLDVDNLTTEDDNDPGRWAPVDHSNYPDLEPQLAQSELGLAVYRDDDDNMVMLVHTENGVFGRTIPHARVLEPAVLRGPAAENATLAAAAQWGLPDFVLPPKKIAKGTASRELGDGTVIFGNRALAIQVKSRDVPTDANPARELNWIAKNAAKGARQAAGTVRTLTATPKTLPNARGRSIQVDAAAYAWVGVVIIDHDQPPEHISTVSSPPSLAVVALLRREWEFLFDQMRSITAVGAYIHRIKDDEVAPGEHVPHYFELANADLEATRNADTDHNYPAQAQRISYPLLPREPASSIDTAGAALYRQLLEDVAKSSWDRPELDRLNVLHMLDQHPVLERAAIGRRLLDQLRIARDALNGETRFEARRYWLGDNHLQLAFSVLNHLSGHHQAVFRGWATLRHHEWISGRPAETVDSCRTVAVLLTPRHDGLRPWDTTMYVLFGKIDVDEEELDSYRRIFGSTA